MNRQNTVTVLLVGYLAVIVALMLSRNISITPDRLFVFLLFAAVIVGRLKSFLRDWAAFAGHLPTEVLQDRFYQAGQVRWYDIGATIMYFLHFPLPLVAAFFLWLKDKSQYYRFIVALLALSFAGFVTFLLFPAAPPWYAANEGLISVTKITDLAVDHLEWNWNLSYYYSHLNPNQVAAIPSLHAAYPALVLLALRRYNRKLFWWLLPYPLLVWLSIVYLGEHYAIDVIAGVIYAAAAYFLVYDFAALCDFA